MQTINYHSDRVASDLSSHLARLRLGLLAQPSVEECAVLSRQTPGGAPEVVAYVVVSGPFVPDRLRAHLAALELPQPWPLLYVPVAALPLTPDGQTDETSPPDPACARCRPGGRMGIPACAPSPASPRRPS